jgi:sugar phosphate isomerase/epimerase
LGYYPNPLDANETQAKFFQDHIKKIILAAAQLGVPVVNTFIGRDISKNVAYNLDRYKEVWPEIVKLAEDNGVKIGIENCPMFFTDDEWPGAKPSYHSSYLGQNVYHYSFSNARAKL